MRKKIWIGIAIGLLAIGGSAAALAFSAGNRADSPRLNLISNQGQVVASLPTSQVNELHESGITSGVRLLGERAGISFYTAQKNGQPCFLTSNREAPRPEFSAVACLGAGTSSMPSAKEPLVDFSAIVERPGDPAPRLTWFAGFAADSVAAVGIVSPDGHVTTTPVVANIYADRGARGELARAIIALDASNREVFRRTFSFGIR